MTVDDWSVFPAIVKPANQHSSCGVSRRSLVENPGELRRQVQWVLEEFGGPAVVEEFVDGREIHVALIGNRDVTMLPPMEIDYSLFGDIHDRIYTNEAKFDKQQLPYYLTKFLCPAPLNAATQQRVEAAALAAYRLGGCRDYGRVDLRLRRRRAGGAGCESQCRSLFRVRSRDRIEDARLDLRPDGGAHCRVRAGTLA